ncbi:aspartate kinase [Scopulibacillus darangshiensis]|uniref:Aspartokinase n=1 Tax=Scopulibacillus darangshiensis TaxID=442528 RepID=A0A4R2P5Y3_9BACL|nr:aspartate kinase [Scopulibacillus darangshiensis]TCP30280.1 aspartate kinase [Scopulibacillus darangshiensis]
MNIIVQKFGGTSVKSEDDRQRAAKHVIKAVDEGYKVVIVVSAMGRVGEPYATDTLLGLVNPRFASPRETDLLMSCGETISSIVFSNMLKENGLKAEALTGGQAGFRTNDTFTRARIMEMKTERIEKMLAALDVVVVAGFQGQTNAGETTTIGRGGSDTSAAALGASLNAEWIDIFTDVKGVMTADPRIVSDARQLSVLTYNEVSNMAYQGAKVIHPRAVEIAMNAKVPMRIRSTHHDDPGTLVTTIKKRGRGQDVQERLITGITNLGGVVQIRVNAKKDDFDLQSKVFKAMAVKQISVDLINISPQGVVYTVMEPLADLAVETLASLGYQPEVLRGCAKVSLVGAGIAGTPGVTAKIVNTLTKSGIRILQSADSHTTIWVLVDEDQMKQAVIALHKTFELEKEDHEVAIDQS